MTCLLRGSHENLGLLGGTEEMDKAIQIKFAWGDNLEFWHMHLPGGAGGGVVPWMKLCT